MKNIALVDSHHLASTYNYKAFKTLINSDNNNICSFHNQVLGLNVLRKPLEARFKQITEHSTMFSLKAVFSFEIFTAF